MPQGDKSAYTDKQQRKAGHIEHDGRVFVQGLSCVHHHAAGRKVDEFHIDPLHALQPGCRADRDGSARCAAALGSKHLCGKCGLHVRHETSAPVETGQTLMLTLARKG